MAPSLIIPKEYLPAGIIALSLTELHHVSPHNVLVERERTHIAGLIQQSFTGLADISAKAAATVSAFNSLQDVLKEGRAFFYGESLPHTVPADESSSLRRAVYALGRSHGFDRTSKLIKKNLSRAIEVEGKYYQGAELAEVLAGCQELERRRIEATHGFSRSVDECVQRLSKDMHLQNTLCAIAGLTDAEKFTQERKDWARRFTKQLFEWNNTATTAGTAFNPILTYDGWLVNLGKYKDVFHATASHSTRPDVFLSDALSHQKKKALSLVVVNILDDIAGLARKHTSIPASPIKDILNIHFLLKELEKDLPSDLAQAHTEGLEKLTTRVLEHADCSVYLIALELDTALPDEDKALILRHFTKAQSLLPALTAPPEESRITHEKRTRIRRELKESLENDRTQLEVQELLGRMQELREASAPSHLKKDATVRYFPERLKEEFDEWLSGFQDFVQSNARELLHGAAKGERVDFKPIPIEKKMFELRLIGGSGIRVYCTRSKGGELVVLGFGTKTSQSQDILTAHERYRNFTAA